MVWNRCDVLLSPDIGLTPGEDYFIGIDKN